MKKLSSIFFLILMLLPMNVLACPHTDENGLLHFQFPNEDYSEMTMMYPRVNYLYAKDVIFKTHEILNESFGFALVQDKQSYHDNYYFVEDRLKSEDWENLEIKTTVEGLDSLLVVGDGYKLNIGLTNTFDSSRQYLSDALFQMYYNVFIDKINEDKNSSKYEKINEIIDKSDLELVVPDIMSLSAEYFLMDTIEYNYNTRQIPIIGLYDDIEFQILSEEKKEDIIAIDIDEYPNVTSSIDCIYDEETKAYKFRTDIIGTYILIPKRDFNHFKEVQIEQILEEEESETETNYLPYIISGIIILMSGIVFIIIKKQK